MILLDPLQIAQPARPRQCQGDEGSAPHQDDGRQDGDALRRQAHDLWRLQTGRVDLRSMRRLMTLRLYFHPLSSFSHKVLIALYENATPFEPEIVNFFEEPSASAFKRLWPVGKIPVLRDETADRTVPESSIIIEYLDPTIRAPALSSRRSRSRPPDAHARSLLRSLCSRADAEDRYRQIAARRRKRSGRRCRGARHARHHARHDRPRPCRQILGHGRRFTLADCAAAPALYYINLIMPLAEHHRHAAAYLDRLSSRPMRAHSKRPSPISSSSALNS